MRQSREHAGFARDGSTGKEQLMRRQSAAGSRNPRSGTTPSRPRRGRLLARRAGRISVTARSNWPVEPQPAKHNLPARLNSFVGREQAMAELAALLTDVRLLTLTGEGGCGKTRLALELAADMLKRFSDGVWVVELAALDNPALVPTAVAAALGV